MTTIGRTNVSAVLSMMVVFDEHQRRGVGKMLLDWGLCLVSEKNALVCSTNM
jgi:hypothetical protein